MECMWQGWEMAVCEWQVDMWKERCWDTICTFPNPGFCHEWRLSRGVKVWVLLAFQLHHPSPFSMNFRTVFKGMFAVPEHAILFLDSWLMIVVFPTQNFLKFHYLSSLSGYILVFCPPWLSSVVIPSRKFPWKVEFVGPFCMQLLCLPVRCSGSLFMVVVVFSQCFEFTESRNMAYLFLNPNHPG